MYTYEEFKQELINQVSEIMGNQKNVKVIAVQKNNHEMKEGIIIQEAGVDSAPVIYMQELYKQYLDDVDMEWCIEQIMLAEAGKYLIDEKEIIRPWDEAKDKIEMQLIKKEWNEEQLRDMPYMEFLDFAIIFRIVFNKSYENMISMQITNYIMDVWNIAVEDLWQAAQKNLENEKFIIKDMEEVVAEMLGIEIDKENLSGSQYVMTNESKVNGAIGMLRTDLFKNFYETRKEKFYILPSSLHELIFVPEKNGLRAEELQEMVREVNRTQVERTEWLSDRVYYYNGKSVELAKVA